MDNLEDAVDWIAVQTGFSGVVRVDRGDEVVLGCDAGVSFHSVHDRARQLTHTVIANTTDGAWPVARYLTDHLP